MEVEVIPSPVELVLASSVSIAGASSDGHPAPSAITSTQPGLLAIVHTNQTMRLRCTIVATFANLLIASGCPSDDAPGVAHASTTAASASDGSTSTTTSSGEVTTTDPTSPSEASETGAPIPQWREVEEVDGALGAFYSVWGRSPDDVYIVGGREEDDAPSGGVVLHYDGASWTNITPAGAPTLHWISPAGDDVWIVGRDGVTLRLEDGTWVPHDSGTDQRLWGVWGSAADDVWTVGGDLSDPLPLLLHFDGTQWSEPVATPTSDARVLFKIWGSAADDVWAVGADGLALHFDGAAWSLIPNESIADLISVFGSGGDVLAVGGRANARLARLTTTAMDAQTLETPGASGVWMDADGVATIVGDMGLLATLSPGTLDPAVDQLQTPLLLHAVFGVDGTLWAVGGDHFDPTPSVGTVFRYGP